MKVLVTGASGFVGQHLITFLKSKKAQIAGTYHTHRPPARHGISYFYCNFLDHEAVLQLLRTIRPTHIFHLAGQSSPSRSWQLPYKTIQGNVFSVIHLLEACRELLLKPKIVFASSAHVYGQMFTEKRIVSELDLPKPMDPYASSKIQSEYFVLQYWYQFRIPSVILRPSAHIGIGQPPFFSISNFAKQISEIERGKAEPVIKVGNLKVERSFMAVEDMARAYWLAMQKARPGEIYNIGSMKLKTMGEWLRLLLGMSKVKIKPKMDPARKRLKEPARIFIDSQKFRKATGWHETIAPETSFQRVLDWWRTHERS